MGRSWRCLWPWQQKRMRRILIIDDDRDLSEMLMEYLSPEGFAVDCSRTGEDGLRRALSESFDLVILDVMLPRMNGFEVLRNLRSQSQCPVIMLTARGQEVDRIVGLEIGSDDYLAKPFSARELLARIHAILRRSRPAESDTDLVAVGDVVLDRRSRMVRRAGEAIDLTSAEFETLEVLLGSAGQVVPREALFDKVLHRAYSVFDRSIDNHVSSLRKKLGPRLGDTERIKAVRNSGYLYAYSAPEGRS